MWAYIIQLLLSFAYNICLVDINISFISYSNIVYESSYQLPYIHKYTTDDE